MALEIIDDGRQDVVVSSARLWLTADRDRVVADGDPDAAFLLVGAGGSLDRSVAERFGLIDADAGEAAADGGDVSQMTLPALRALADDLGIDHSGMKKADLVAALESATTGDETAPEEA